MATRRKPARLTARSKALLSKLATELGAHAEATASRPAGKVAAAVLGVRSPAQAQAALAACRALAGLPGEVTALLGRAEAALPVLAEPAKRKRKPKRRGKPARVRTPASPPEAPEAATLRVGTGAMVRIEVSLADLLRALSRIVA